MLKDYTTPLVLALIVTLIGLIGSEAQSWLRFDRSAILNGQLWRLISGHLAHLGWSHLWMNLAGLGLIWALFAKAGSTRLWLSTLIIGCLGTSVFLLLFNPGLYWYVGLSGVLHTLFVLGALLDIQRFPRSSIALLLFVSGKLAYEQLFGPLPGSESSAGGKVIVDAHLYGAIWGIIIYAARSSIKRLKTRQSPV